MREQAFQMGYCWEPWEPGNPFPPGPLAEAWDEGQAYALETRLRDDP